MTKEQEESGQRQAEQNRLPVHLDPMAGKKTQFKPGQSGNPKGRPKGKSLSKTIQEMLDDEGFIERLHDEIRQRFSRNTDGPDPVYQSTPMKAMITVAMIEAIDPTEHPKTRAEARKFLATFGYGTKVDITSKGERITETPKIVSPIAARQTDAATEAEAS